MEQSAFILLVEDNDEFRNVLKELLESSGFHVTAAANANRACEALDLGKFDLCILDVRLPDGNGIELMREFRKSDPDMGIIIMTGYAEVDTAIDAVRLGANDVLKKPFVLDSPKPRMKLADYAYTEMRYKHLVKTHPEEAARLMTLAQESADLRWATYEYMSKQESSEFQPMD